MRKTPRWPFVALALTGVYALARLVDTEQRWAALQIELGGDRVEHAALTYLLTIFILAAFPRLPVWAPAAGLTGLGLAVEGVQALPFVVGGAQAGDVVANLLGAALATLPIWMLRGRLARG